MNTFLRRAAVLSVVAAALILLILKGSGPATVARQQTPQDQKQEKIKRLKFQTFRGEAAALRANQLRAKSKAVKRAMNDAEKRGKHPAFAQGAVILGTDPDNAASPGTAKSVLDPSASYRRASFASSAPQDFWSDGYEIAVIPYDSPSTTWEGIIYRNGPDIDEDIAYAVIDISGDEPSVIQDSYYPPDGGDPTLLLILARRSNANTSACSSMVSFQTVRTSFTKDVFRWTGRPSSTRHPSMYRERGHGMLRPY